MCSGKMANEFFLENNTSSMYLLFIVEFLYGNWYSIPVFSTGQCSMDLPFFFFLHQLREGQDILLSDEWEFIFSYQNLNRNLRKISLQTLKGNEDQRTSPYSSLQRNQRKAFQTVPFSLFSVMSFLPSFWPPLTTPISIDFSCSFSPHIIKTTHWDYFCLLPPATLFFCSTS